MPACVSVCMRFDGGVRYGTPRSADSWAGSVELWSMLSLLAYRIRQGARVAGALPRNPRDGERGHNGAIGVDGGPDVERARTQGCGARTKSFLTGGKCRFFDDDRYFSFVMQ